MSLVGPEFSGEEIMGYAIALFFDLAACQKLEEARQAILRAAGMPLPVDARSQPHITLAMFETIEDPASVDKILRKFSRTVPPFPIQMASAGLFPTEEEVIFLAPVTTRRLLDVHVRLHRELKRAGLVSIPYYRPEQWVPHCTVSVGLKSDAKARALESILHSGAFGAAVLSEIGLVQYDPIKYLGTHPLGGG
jgi:2'-5' RNA ligase